MRNARDAPAHRNACSIPETAHPTANAGIRMRRLSNGNRILVGRRSLSCGSCRDLLARLFVVRSSLRWSACPTLRMRGRRVGQANHQAGRWTDEGVSIRAVECATRESAGPPECVLHPGDRASHGKRWFSDAPFVKWKPDPGGPALRSLVVPAATC